MPDDPSDVPATPPPSVTPSAAGLSPARIGIAGVGIAMVAGWLFWQGRQAGVDARTRARLYPPAGAPRAPSAADIHVA